MRAQHRHSATTQTRPDADVPHDEHVVDRTGPGDVERDTVGATPVALARAAVARQHDAFGGMKIGAAFFGFLTAAGMAVLLTAVAVAAGAVVGIGADAEVAAEDVGTIGVWSAVVVGALVLVAYYCGGYVAGRMARFDGAKQGFAVWLWTLVIGVVVAVLTALAGAEYNVFAQLNLFPRIPVDEGDLTAVGIAAAAGAAVLALIGTVLGGLAGVRFHRRVDRAGLDV